jgi:hypothetical protein
MEIFFDHRDPAVKVRADICAGQISQPLWHLQATICGKASAEHIGITRTVPISRFIFLFVWIKLAKSGQSTENRSHSFSEKPDFPL